MMLVIAALAGTGTLIARAVLPRLIANVSRPTLLTLAGISGWLFAIAGVLAYGEFMGIKLHGGPLAVMGLGIAIFIGGVVWQAHGAEAQTPPPAQAASPAMPPTTPPKPPPPSSEKPPTYQQFNYDNKGTILQGPITVKIAPSPDPQGMVTSYDFSGIKRESNGHVTNMYDKPAGQAFEDLMKLGDDKNWTEMLSLSDKMIMETDGGWIGAYAFRAIALLKTGKTAEGDAMLKEVRDVVKKRDLQQQKQYAYVVKKYLMTDQ